MIYCVEDDSNIRDLMLYALQAAGFEAAGFEESGPFWEALKESLPDLILLEHPGQVFSRAQLLEKAWGIDYAGETRTVDVHIGTLRTKLGDAGRLITTVRGVGYKLEVPDDK